MAIISNISPIANGGVISYPILPAAMGLIVEGMALVGQNVGGTMYAKPSTDSTSDIFLGIAFGPRRELSAVAQETRELTVSAGNLTFNLGRNAAVTGASANPRVYKINPTTGAITEFTIGTAAAGVVSVDSLTPLTLTFNVADAGKVYVSYNFVANASDVQYVGGIQPTAYFRAKEDTLGLIAVINQGVVATDQIEASAVWSGAGDVRCVAGGLFTYGGSLGTPLTGSGVILREGPSFGKNYALISVNQ